MFSRDVCCNLFLQVSYGRLTDRLTSHPLQSLQSRPTPTQSDMYRVQSVTCNRYLRYRNEHDDTYVNRKGRPARDPSTWSKISGCRLRHKDVTHVDCGTFNTSIFALWTKVRQSRFCHFRHFSAFSFQLFYNLLIFIFQIIMTFA